MTTAQPATKTAAKKPAATPRKVAKSPAKSAAATPRKRAAPTPKVPVAKPAAAREKPLSKLVRDSFTMPQQDFELIPALKKRALAFQRPAKKSELLRAGLQALAALDDRRLKEALDSLVAIKAGRPKKLR